MPERLDEKELVDWRAGCDAVVASRFTEISFLSPSLWGEAIGC
jgi:hypothetical protein